MEDRSGLRSTVVASQLPVDKWHPSMADPTLADVLLTSRRKALVDPHVLCAGRSPLCANRAISVLMRLGTG